MSSVISVSNGNSNGTCNNYYPFQTNSEIYAKYRTKPPNTLIQTIINCLQDKSKNNSSGTTNAIDGLAVDIGCGTGQVTNLLQPFFKKVIGVDISEAQIKKAQELQALLFDQNENKNNVDYR